MAFDSPLLHRALLLGAGAATLVLACSSEEDQQPPPPVVVDDRPDNTGAACAAPADCYPDVAAGTIEGEVQCLDRVDGGYCTHDCTSDEDCCAAEGECDPNELQVCSPFEDTGDMLCFLSCETEDLFPAPGEDGPVDDNEFCQRQAGFDFICRSSGGGSSNRKICVPGDCGLGSACTATADCPGDLECATTFGGRTLCTTIGCTAGSCPEGSACVADASGESFCHPACASDFDCSFCRGAGDGTCSDTVETVGGDIVSACID